MTTAAPMIINIVKKCHAPKLLEGLGRSRSSPSPSGLYCPPSSRLAASAGELELSVDTKMQ